MNRLLRFIGVLVMVCSLFEPYVEAKEIAKFLHPEEFLHCETDELEEDTKRHSQKVKYVQGNVSGAGGGLKKLPYSIFTAAL